MKINVLGTKYTIEERTEHEDEFLKKFDGYCDKTSKRIVIVKEKADSELDNWRVYRNQCLRHEIIHAFMIESGLQNDWQHPNEFGHDETTIDWIAIQFPKMLKAFKEAGCI